MCNKFGKKVFGKTITGRQESQRILDKSERIVRKARAPARF